MDKTILVIGTKQASVSLEEFYKKISSSLFSEKIIVATCNRTEIYIVTSDKKNIENKLNDLENIYIYSNQEAVTHLLHVACGIDSVVLGELEILGQIRKAYKKAIIEKTVGPILHQLYKEALRVGKLARTTTAIAAGSSSIAYAVKNLSEKKLKTNEKYTTLIIGAGEVAQQVAKSLVHHTEITITNRTYDKALTLAKQFGGKAMPFEQLETSLQNFDVIVAATNSQRILISAMLIKKIMKQRKKKLCLIDLSVPNNIDPQMTKIPQVSFYTLDDVQRLMNKNRKVREQAIDQVNELIKSTRQKFWEWYILRDTVPILEALTEQALYTQQTELQKTLKKLEHLNLTPREQKIITTLSTRITNKLLAVPIRGIKRLVSQSKTEIDLEILKELFTETQ